MTLSEYLNPERPVERLQDGCVILQENEVIVWTDQYVNCRVAVVHMFGRNYHYRTRTISGKTLYAQDERGKLYKPSVFKLNF